MSKESAVTLTAEVGGNGTIRWELPNGVSLESSVQAKAQRIIGQFTACAMPSLSPMLTHAESLALLTGLEENLRKFQAEQILMLVGLQEARRV